MNEIIQHTLVFVALILALAFLVRTFIWKPKKATSTKACGKDQCGCH